MKKYILPSKDQWSEICARPTLKKNELTGRVAAIIDEVRTNGDQALFELTEKLDGAQLMSLQVTESEFQIADSAVKEPLKRAIDVAKRNIEKFHQSQKEAVLITETSPGVQCWRKSVGIEKVGLYIPGGSAPLFSTVLMLGIPANIAGCEEIILCTPPDKSGKVNPAILYAAQLVGITKVFKLGGAQAIAAMTFGTETIPQVYKIFGPGNQYVTKAKELVQQEGVAIDMPAGPSEVLVIADTSCNPSFVASDLLSQAEHGSDSQVILLSDNREVLDQVEQEIAHQLEKLPRKELAFQALENSKSILCGSIEECLALSNFYAPEHLILAMTDASIFADKIKNAGSVFLGNYSCESAGDYASGTNHTLPTNGYAKNYSGVSLDSFVRKITFQKLTAEGLKSIGPAIEEMAEAEDLFAHKNAVTLRLKSLKNV